MWKTAFKKFEGILSALEELNEAPDLQVSMLMHSELWFTEGFLLSRKKDHCVKSIQIQSFFWSVFPRIRNDYGKIRTGKTPYLDTFQTVDLQWKYLNKYWSKQNITRSVFSVKTNSIRQRFETYLRSFMKDCRKSCVASS